MGATFVMKKLEHSSRAVISGFSLFHREPSAYEGQIVRQGKFQSPFLKDLSGKIFKENEFSVRETENAVSDHSVRKVEYLAYRAIADASLTDIDSSRTDIIFGGRSGLVSRGIKKILELNREDLIHNYNHSAAAVISDMLGTAGYVYTSPVTSILHSLGTSFQRISKGRTDLVLAGETNLSPDSVVTPVGGEDILARILHGSSQKDFSFVRNHLHDSGVLFIIEDLNLARLRGREPYAEIEDYEEYYSYEIDNILHNGGHAKNLANQVMLALLSLVMNQSPKNLCSDDCFIEYIKNIEYEKRGNKISRVSVGGLTGTGLKGRLTLKRFQP
ncbi:MAG: hypothetical protein OEZ34_02650 [Spirochaetia bacterium]|nr:hypothetical protein [Spirochaetia bacterium]